VKKKIVLLLVSLLLVSFMSTAVMAQDENYEKEYTYVINTMNVDSLLEDPRLDLIKEKFNVDFEFRPVNWGNWDERVRIWTASGDMPDVMWTDLQNKFTEYVNWASQGAYKPIPKFGDKYPNLQAIRDKLKSDDYWEINGELYAMPVPMGTVDWRDPLVDTFNFIYRVDWAKEVGLFNKDHEYSWDEMVEMAEAFIEKNPGENRKTIGIGGIGWAWPWFAGLRQTHQMNTYTVKDGEYVWAPAQPEFLAGIKETKKLYDQGIIWEDQPIANNDAAKNKFIAGELGIYFDNISVGDYSGIMNSITAADKNVELADVSPMFVTSPKGNYFAEELLDHWSATIYNPEMSDAKLARWLEIENYMAGKKGQRLSTLGIEGKDYQIDENDEVEILWEKDEDGNLINPYDTGVRFFQLTTMHDEFDLNNPNLADKIKNDVKSILRRKLEDDVYVKPQPYEVTWFAGDDYTRYNSRLGDTMAEVSDVIVSTNSMEELENKWQEYIDSKRDTVDIILEELNQELLKE